MKLLNYCKLSIQSSTANEAFARSTVAAFCASLNPTLEQINDIKTAVSEAVNNCVIHGYAGGSGEIYIEVALFDSEVSIQIQDQGCGIPNVNEAMQPFFTGKPQEERSGMGFTLMQAFMDEVDVVSTLGQGTTVVMRKRLDSHA